MLPEFGLAFAGCVQLRRAGLSSWSISAMRARTWSDSCCNWIPRGFGGVSLAASASSRCGDLDVLRCTLFFFGDRGADLRLQRFHLAAASVDSDSMRSRAAAAERRRSSSPASLRRLRMPPARPRRGRVRIAGNLFLRGCQFVFNGLPLLLQASAASRFSAMTSSFWLRSERLRSSSS